jgi:hypothetical protein
VADICFDGSQLWIGTGEKGIDVLKMALKKINFSKENGSASPKITL